MAKMSPQQKAQIEKENRWFEGPNAEDPQAFAEESARQFAADLDRLLPEGPLPVGPERGLPFCPTCGAEMWLDDGSVFCPGCE